MRAALQVHTLVLSSAPQPDAAVVAPVQSCSRRAATAHQIIVRVLLGGLALQLFFAGRRVFAITTFLAVVWVTSLVEPVRASQAAHTADPYARGHAL
jgi:hypothetical protein